MTEPSLGLLSLRTQAVLYVSLILWSYRPKVYIEERLYTSSLSGSVNAKAASRGGGGLFEGVIQQSRVEVLSIVTNILASAEMSYISERLTIELLP